jgi:hypothetical protein
VAQGTLVRSLKTWEFGPPSFALEVVSLDWEKDYLYVPGRYAEMGVRELVVFDPSSQERADGHRWQVFRRVGKRFLRVEVSDEDRVRSKSLGCWLRVVGEGDSLRVRLATGREGDLIFPTSDEAERAARQAEAARADTEHAARLSETARADAERARADAAEAELAKLRALLGKRLRRATSGFGKELPQGSVFMSIPSPPSFRASGHSGLRPGAEDGSLARPFKSAEPTHNAAPARWFTTRRGSPRQGTWSV